MSAILNRGIFRMKKSSIRRASNLKFQISRCNKLIIKGLHLEMVDFQQFPLWLFWGTHRGIGHIEFIEKTH